MRITKYKTRLTEDKKVKLEKEVSVNCPTVDRKITSPGNVDKLARDFLHIHEESEEYAYMLCLNTKNVLTAVLEIGHGNVNSAIIGVRETFQKALLANAVSIILIHNHPSGDCTPSPEDIRFTERMVEAGRIINVEVLDHMIIGDRWYYSLKEHGHII